MEAAEDMGSNEDVEGDQDVEATEDELLTVWLGNSPNDFLVLDDGGPTDDTVEGSSMRDADDDPPETWEDFTSVGRTAVKDQVMDGGRRSEEEVELGATLVTDLVMVIWTVD